MNDLVTPALELARLGYNVIGSGGPKGNNPSVSGSGWQRLNYRSEQLIEALDKPNVTGIGAITTGLAVIDLDVKNGIDGVKELFSWLREHDKAGIDLFSVAPRVRTPTGGVHYYFKDPAHEVTNSGGMLAGLPGVDVRGVGGFICMPPTQRKGTEGYAWERNPQEIQDLPLAPVWLIGGNKQLPDNEGWQPTDSEWGKHQLVSTARTVATAKNGCRNETLHLQSRAMAHLVCEGQLSVGTVRSVLLAGAIDAGLSEYESRSTIDSGIRWVLTSRGDALIAMADNI
jgi:hypothetical protein